MPIDQKAALFSVLLICICMFLLCYEEYQRNRAILKREKFYRGIRDEPRRRWQFWLPVFLYRRRRRLNGHLRPIKRMHSV